MYKADALSRLPLPVTVSEKKYISFVSNNEFPLNSVTISKYSLKDPLISKLMILTKEGWLENTNDDQLKPFFSRKDELSVEQNCLLWGFRVVIPEKLRKTVLNLLHKDHPGICRMKALARTIVWWPSMDEHIENLVKNCEICEITKGSSAKVPLQPWPWARRPMQRIHIDFAKKYGVTFFIIIDSHTKWIEVFIMSKTTAGETIAKLRSIFSRFGIPEELISDNGPPFSSEEFVKFCQELGIKIHKIAPYHPASNGQAERAVQIIKAALLKKSLDKQSNDDLQSQLDKLLFTYRNTPHTMTKKTPAEMLFKYSPRTELTMLRPYFNGTMQEKTDSIKNKEDKYRGEEREFSIGENVLVRSVRGEEMKWMRGKILVRKTKVLYLVMVNGQTRLCHADHLKKTLLLPLEIPDKNQN